MRIRVLGSAAGGAFPQWNCNCANCSGIRSGKIRAQIRTQSSIAVSDDVSDNYVLLNASPDIGTQLRAWAQSQPKRNVRDTALVAVMLVDSQIDHSSGLLTLRENGKLTLYCTDPVYEDLSKHFPVLRVLESYLKLDRHSLPRSSDIFKVNGIEGICFRAIPVQGKAPPYSPRRNNGVVGDNIAIEITDVASNKKCLYAPGLEVIDDAFAKGASDADCLLIDGTFWTDDEMQQNNISNKRAKDMGHLCLSGEGGTLEFLQSLGAKRKILIHINNTNPILNEDSKQRKILDKLGVEVAHDEMEIVV